MENPPRAVEDREEVLDSDFLDREPSFSADGHFVTFSSARSGPLNIWMRELATGKETHLAASPQGQRFSLLDATGSRVAYSQFEKSGRRSIYLWSRDEAPRKISAHEKSSGEASAMALWARS